jgi:hypothetical protein
MDKIILVHYINIDGVPNSSLGEMMEMIKESLAKDADIISYTKNFFLYFHLKY